MVPPGSVSRCSGSTAVHSPVWKAVDQLLDANSAAEQLRTAILSSLSNRVVHFGNISADLSGGMDSTSLSYLLAALTKSAIFYHAGTVDQANRDTEFALRAAAELNGTFVELEPFSATMSAFAVEQQGLDDGHDGPWAWASNAKHLHRLLSDAASRGIRAHVTGLGGDELFSVMPTIALALKMQGQAGKAVRALNHIAKTQRWSLAATFRSAASKETLTAELQRRARTQHLKHDDVRDAFAWAPGFSQSPFATQKTHDLVIEQVDATVNAGLTPWFEDKYRHQIAESIMFQGEVVRQMNHAYRDLGVTVEAPFLDDDVVSLVLGFPPHLTAGNRLSKPLLAAATTPVVPAWVFERTDKGEYSFDLFTEFKRGRRSLTTFFADSYLIDNGYIAPDKIRDALESPVVGTDQLFALQQLTSVERWARRHA